MVTIFLRAVKNEAGDGYDLAMRDTGGNLGTRSLPTIVESEEMVAWELEKKSGIQDIIRIWIDGKHPKGKVFKSEPKRVLARKKFQVDAVETDEDIDDKYNIRFKTDDGKTVTIDPYIRVVPPHP